jgi:tetratricopeptide (TPR) repeat protein
VLRAANRWKEAIAAGQAYVAADPTAADSGYYQRLISDYASDSAYGKAAEAAAQAIAKYPRNANLYLLKAQNERRAGQLDAAIASLRKGLELDPKAPGANLLLAQMNVDTGKLDEAIAAVKADVAADPTNKERNAQFLLGLGSNAYRAAAASKKPEDFQKAMKLSQASDEMNPSPQAKFIAAVAAWQLLAPSLQQGSKWRCDDVRAAEANLTVVSTMMPGGGSVDAATAGSTSTPRPSVSASNRQSVSKARTPGILTDAGGSAFHPETIRVSRPPAPRPAGAARAPADRRDARGSRTRARAWSRRPRSP